MKDSVGRFINFTNNSGSSINHNIHQLNSLNSLKDLTMTAGFQRARGRGGYPEGQREGVSRGLDGGDSPSPSSDSTVPG